MPRLDSRGNFVKPLRRNQNSARIITGDREIDKALAEIAKVGTANRIARAGLGRSIRVIVKAIKSECQDKSVKKAIKGYVKKNKRKGVIEAKVGAVGKQDDPVKDRSGKEGVGITGRNIHWYILGTDSRRPKKKKVMKTSQGRFMGKEVGPMPAHPAVRDGYAKAESQAKAALRDGCEQQLIRETNKAKAKAGVK